MCVLYNFVLWLFYLLIINICLLILGGETGLIASDQSTLNYATVNIY